MEDWSVTTISTADYFGSATFNLKVSGMPISLHDVPANRWVDGTEESHAYLWIMSGIVVVCDINFPETFSSVRSALDEALEPQRPVLFIISNVKRSKDDALAALQTFAKNFGLEAVFFSLLASALCIVAGALWHLAGA